MADDTTTPDADATAVQTPAVPEKLQQTVEITNAGPCKKHVKVTIDRAAINTRMDEKFSDLMVKTPAHIPGFRPGKAPKKIVQKKFYKEIAGEVRTEVLMASLEQLADEADLSPLSPPELDPAGVVIPEDENTPLVYEFNIEVRPEFDLPDYKGLKLRRPVYEFTDADVKKEGNKLLEQYGTIVPKDGPAAMDDIIVSDITIKDGETELNKVADVRLRVEKKLALEDGVAEDFGKVMTGAKAGDTRTVDITLANELTNDNLRGKKVQAVFEIKDVKTVRLPELTPDVLQEFGVRTPDQFNELVRTRLERYLEYLQRNVARAEVLKVLAGNQSFELPQDLLKKQIRKTLARRVMEMRSSGMNDEEIAGRRRLLEQDAVRSTAAALKEHFVLQKIAEQEKLEIEDADIDAEIDAIADRTNDSPRKVKARLEREDLIEALATELLERRALELVLQSATYDDYTFNPMKEMDEEGVATVDASATDEQITPAAG
ncbi:MAG: trigger factor [Fimbriiglobus sp.]|nr:trigger factor [Fimbriiglobus sp.]